MASLRHEHGKIFVRRIKFFNIMVLPWKVLGENVSFLFHEQLFPTANESFVTCESFARKKKTICYASLVERQRKKLQPAASVCVSLSMNLDIVLYLRRIRFPHTVLFFGSNSFLCYQWLFFYLFNCFVTPTQVQRFFFLVSFKYRKERILLLSRF